MEITRSMDLSLRSLRTLIEKRSPWSVKPQRMSEKRLRKVHYLVSRNERAGKGTTSESGAVNGEY